MTTKLNPKQQRFVATYLIDLNATQAAIKAGYSKKTARSQGQRLLTHIDVSEAIAAKTVKRLEQLDVTAERVLREYAQIEFMDIRKIFNDDGAMKPIGELGDDEAAVIAGVEVGVPSRTALRLAASRRSNSRISWEPSIRSRSTWAC